MTAEPDQVDVLLSTEFVEGIEEASVEEVRAKRDACQRAEVALSYVRRVLQGKLDLIEAEQARRAGGGLRDASALIDKLPEILAGAPAVAGSGRSTPHQPMVTMPGVAAGLAEAFEVELSAISGLEDLAGNLGVLDDATLDEVANRIRATEAKVSARRKRLHDRIEQIQAQIVARWMSGEANVQSLLQQGRAGAGQ
jgi:hypothetical protein